MTQHAPSIWPARASAPPLLAVVRAACLGPPTVPMTALDDTLVGWAVETGLGPLLARAAAADPEAATAPLWPLVQHAILTARFVAAEQVQAMSEILDAWPADVPPPVLLKGISLCDQHYPEPHLRPMRDIDFLVEPENTPGAEATLLRLGYRQWSGRPAAFYADHHHSSPFVHADTGVWVDVHRALFAPRSALGSSRMFAPASLGPEIRHCEFRGRPARRLSDELQLVHVACHWARGLRAVGGMVAMADVGFIVKNAPALDWARIAGWMESSPAARPVGVLLTYVARHRIIDIAPEILQRVRANETARGQLAGRVAHALLDRYVVGGRDFGPLISERNFNRLWKLLVFGGTDSGNGALRDWRASRPPVSAADRLGETTRVPDPITAEHGHRTEPGVTRDEEVMTMSRDGTDAGSADALRHPAAWSEEPQAAGTASNPRRRPGVRVREVDGELLILDRQRQLVHQVNRTASFIWDRCDGHHTMRQIAEALAEHFDVDRVAAEHDVDIAVNRLQSLGLIETQTESIETGGGGRNGVRTDSTGG